MRRRACVKCRARTKRLHARLPDLVVRPQRAPLRGVVPVPADKSITHRALLFGGLAEGKSLIQAEAHGEDNKSTLAALRALGVATREEEHGVVLHGRGLEGLSEPA